MGEGRGYFSGDSKRLNKSLKVAGAARENRLLIFPFFYTPGVAGISRRERLTIVDRKGGLSVRLRLTRVRQLPIGIGLAWPVE